MRTQLALPTIYAFLVPFVSTACSSPRIASPPPAPETLVFFDDGKILGKPADEEDAARMLRVLSGREHRVVTAVRLRRGPDPGMELVEISAVRIAPLSEREIAWYVSTGEPRDKAGAYAIQGRASRYIEKIEGSYFNVVGLPIALVYRLLRVMQSSDRRRWPAARVRSRRLLQWRPP